MRGKLRWWIIGLVTLGTVLNYLARSTLSVAAPTLKAEFSMSTEDYSWVVLAFQLAYTVMQTVAGTVLDALGTPMTTEQLTRLLDGLREGEGGVKHGLSEKINFEVALLKAVEASRSRAIDSLIKELAALADESPTAAPAAGRSATTPTSPTGVRPPRPRA